MKKIIFALALAACAPAHANGNDYATITSVKPVYIDRYVTAYTTECYDVEVPVYGRTQGGGASGGDVLAGMILGGLLGGTVSGKDSGAAAGAVLGGIISAENGNTGKQVITGYRYEERCEKVKKSVNDPVVSYYRIKYTYNGFSYSQDTARRYDVGEKVRIQLSLN